MKCPTCGGSGYLGGPDLLDICACPNCDGYGYIDDEPKTKPIKGNTRMNVLDFVTEPAKAIEGFHGILYGPPGCGKTSTLDDDKLKVLDIDLEGGSAVLNGAPNVKRIDIPEMAKKAKIHQFEAFLEVGKAIDAGKFADIDLISPDSFTAFEDITKDYVATVYAPNRRREIEGKFGAQSDWGDLQYLISKTVRWFHTFTKRGEKSHHVLWMAHVLEERDADTQRLTRTKISLQGSKTPDIVMSVVDGYFYMYNKGVTVEGTDGKKVEMERGILTMQSGPYSAKARQSKRMEALPAKIITPVWSDIFNQLGYVRQA